MLWCFSLYLQWIFIVWVFILRCRLPRPFVINLHFNFHVSIKFHGWKVSLDDKCEAWRPNTSERNVADIIEMLKDMKDYIGYKSQCYRDRCLKDTFNHSLFVHTRWCFCCCDWSQLLWLHLTLLNLLHFWHKIFWNWVFMVTCLYMALVPGIENNGHLVIIDSVP